MLRRKENWNERIRFTGLKINLQFFDTTLYAVYINTINTIYGMFFSYRQNKALNLQAHPKVEVPMNIRTALLRIQSLLRVVSALEL